MAKGLSCLTLASVLQQQNTIADFERGEFSHQIWALQTGSWGEKGGKKTSSQEGGGDRWGEAMVMERKGSPGDAGKGRKVGCGY